MNKCKGLMGRIFGHKFEDRYDEEVGEGKLPDSKQEIYIDSLICDGLPNIINSTKSCKRTYVYDICTRCGEKIERAK